MQFDAVHASSGPLRKDACSTFAPRPSVKEFMSRQFESASNDHRGARPDDTARSPPSRLPAVTRRSGATKESRPRSPRTSTSHVSRMHPDVRSLFCRDLLIRQRRERNEQPRRPTEHAAHLGAAVGRVPVRRTARRHAGSTAEATAASPGVGTRSTCDNSPATRSSCRLGPAGADPSSRAGQLHEHRSRPDRSPGREPWSLRTAIRVMHSSWSCSDSAFSSLPPSPA